MPCRSRKSKHSLVSFARSGFDGPQCDGPTYRRRTANCVPWVYQPGRTSCCKRQSGSSWKPTTSHSLARILMGFVLTEAVIPRCGRWNKPGQEPNGSLKAISRDVSIDSIIRCSLISYEKTFMITGSFGSSHSFLTPDIYSNH